MFAGTSIALLVVGLALLIRGLESPDYARIDEAAAIDAARVQGTLYDTLEGSVWRPTALYQITSQSQTDGPVLASLHNEFYIDPDGTGYELTTILLKGDAILTRVDIHTYPGNSGNVVEGACWLLPPATPPGGGFEFETDEVETSVALSAAEGSERLVDVEMYTAPYVWTKYSAEATWSRVRTFVPAEGALAGGVACANRGPIAQSLGAGAWLLLPTDVLLKSTDRAVVLSEVSDSRQIPGRWSSEPLVTMTGQMAPGWTTGDASSIALLAGSETPLGIRFPSALLSDAREQQRLGEQVIWGSVLLGAAAGAPLGLLIPTGRSSDSRTDPGKAGRSRKGRD